MRGRSRRRWSSISATSSIAGRTARPFSRVWRSGSPIPGELINLRGNHEELCLDAMQEGGEASRIWRRNGGETCLSDWGVPKKAPASEWESFVPP